MKHGRLRGAMYKGVNDVVANPFVVGGRMRLPLGGWQAMGRGGRGDV